MLATPGFRGRTSGARTGLQFGGRHVDKPRLETAAAFNKDGTLLAVARQDGGVRIWDVAKGDAASTFRFTRIGPRTSRGARTGSSWRMRSADRTVHVLSATAPSDGRLVGNLAGHSAAVRAIAWSPDGRSLLSGSADGTARLWDAQFDQELLALGAFRGAAVEASLTRPGAASSRQATTAARIWSVGGRHLLHVSRTSARSRTPSSAPTAAWS